MPDEALPWKWVLSDTHFRLTHDVFYRPADADDLIAEAWRSLIQPGDPVLHLGDINGLSELAHLAGRSGVRKAQDLTGFLAGLPGQVSVLLGNWDGGWALDAAREAGWTVISGTNGNPAAAMDIIYRECLIEFSHFPDEDPLPDGSLKVHGHVHPPSRCYRGHAHAPGMDVADHYELTSAHINAAVSVNNWRPTLLRQILNQRIARARGSPC